MQALMFAIYFAAVTSLTPEECIVQFGEHKQELLARYRYGTEQALVQAQLLNSSEMVTLQALVIYLVCLDFGAATVSGVRVMLLYRAGETGLINV